MRRHTLSPVREMNPTSQGKEDFQVRARFRHALKAARVADGSTLLIAVSGGCDSVTLLHLCVREARNRSWNLVAGHVDHSLRPESAEEAALVRGLCLDLGVEFETHRIPPEQWLTLGSRSPEEPARMLRRRALRQLAARRNADWILLGHTMDDQAETVLLNLLRGSSVRGLAGMDPHRWPWLRPLLGVRRPQLREYAKRAGLDWIEDPTNLDDRFARNRLRNSVIPAMESRLDSPVVRVLARTADAMRPVRRHLASLAGEAWKHVCIEQTPSLIRLDRPQLAGYDRAVAEEILRSAVRHMRGTARDLKRAPVAHLARSLGRGGPAAYALPSGIEARLDSREVRFLRPAGDGTGGE